MIKSSKRGFITTIVLLIVAIILLKYWLHIDVLKFLMSPKVKEFFLEVWNFLSQLWNDYLKPAITGTFELVRNLLHR